MKWSNIKQDSSDYYCGSYHKTAKKKHIKATMEYTGEFGHYYYFLLDALPDFAYNSLWDGLRFDTEEECMKVCEDYIDRKVEEWFPSK